MSLRLRQPYSPYCAGPKSQGVPPSPHPHVHGCHGEQISPAALCHTHADTFSLSSSLSFLSLTFYRAAPLRGTARESFLSTDNAWCVMDILIHIQCKEEESKCFPSHNTWQHIYFLSAVGSQRLCCTCQVRL